MDDIQQAFGAPAPQSPIEEAWHIEQRRKQFDIIRVANPLKVTIQSKVWDIPPKDFYVEYDTNQYQKISAGTTKDIPRSRAERYVEHKKDEIVNYVTKVMHDEFLAERRTKGIADFKNKAEENAETYETSSYPKTNDPAIVAEIYGQLWVGLVNKAGSDIPPELVDKRSGEVDLKSSSRKALDALANRTVASEDQGVAYTPPPSVYKPNFSGLSEKLSADEITNE